MAGNIGIIGRARVGKDTAGAWLVENRGYERVSFADPLKEAALRLNPYVTKYGAGPMLRMSDIVRDVGWDRAKDGYPEVRRTLQELGMAIRAIDEEFWLRTALKRVQEVNEAGKSAVITDVRFPNEADSLRRAGFHLLHIDRPDVPQLTHASEGALTSDDAHVTIENSRSVPEFLADVERVADLLDFPQRYALGIS